MARVRRKTGKGNSVAAAKARDERVAADEDGYGAWYREELLPEVVDAGRIGMSETEIASYIFDVPRATMRAMAKRHPELQRALDRARDHAKSWWESTARIRLRTPNFNTHLFNKIISCRFRDEYSERVTVEGDADRPLVHKIERVIVKAPKAARPT